jgi:hypothetical protein
MLCCKDRNEGFAVKMKDLKARREVGSGVERRRWDLNPRRLAPYTISSRAH